VFGNRQDGRQTAAMRAIKQEAQALFEATETDVVLVNELRCDEPGCPPIETIVALLRAGAPPRQLKVHKPLVDVTVEDLRAAWLGQGHARHH
jgi:hypothetical protein